MSTALTFSCADAAVGDLLYAFFGTYRLPSHFLHELYLQEAGTRVDSRFGVRFGQTGFCRKQGHLYLLLYADPFDGVAFCQTTTHLYHRSLFYSLRRTSEVPLLYDGHLGTLETLFVQSRVTPAHLQPLVDHYLSWIAQLPDWLQPPHLARTDS